MIWWQVHVHLIGYVRLCRNENKGRMGVKRHCLKNIIQKYSTQTISVALLWMYFFSSFR